MNVKVVTCINENEYDLEWLKAQYDGRILLAIKPRRKYSELVFDTYTANPDICRQLNEDGVLAVKFMHDAYLRVLTQFGKVPRTLREVSYGPNWGSLFVLKSDSKRIAERLRRIINNSQYWEHY